MATKRNQNGCGGCGYTWFPRGKNRSSKCPQCGSGSVVVYARARPQKKKGCLSTKVALILLGLMIIGALIPDGDTEGDSTEPEEVQKVVEQTKAEVESGQSSDRSEAKTKEISDDQQTSSEVVMEKKEPVVVKPTSEKSVETSKPNEIPPKSVRTPKFDPAIKGNVTVKGISIGKVEARYKESRPALELYLLVKDNPNTRVFGVKSQATVGTDFTDYIKLLYDRELHILFHLRRTAYSPRIGLKDQYRWVIWKNVTPEHFKESIPFLDESLPQLLSEAKNHKKFPIRYTHYGSLTSWP